MMVPVNLAFSGIGTGELLFVFLVVLIFFGPRRLPELARTIGRMMNELRRASREFQDQVMQLDAEPPSASSSQAALPPAPEAPPADLGGPPFDSDTSPGEAPAPAEPAEETVTEGERPPPAPGPQPDERHGMAD